MKNLTEIEKKRAITAWIIAGVSLLMGFVLFFFGSLEDHFQITFYAIVIILYSSNIACWFISIDNYSKITTLLKISIIVLNVFYYVVILIITDGIKINLTYYAQLLSKIILGATVFLIEISLFVQAAIHKKAALAAPALFHTVGLLLLRGCCDFMILAVNGM